MIDVGKRREISGLEIPMMLKTLTVGIPEQAVCKDFIIR